MEERKSAQQACAAESAAGDGLRKATFAGGCFWCMEHPFDSLPGVVSVTPGYTGGEEPNPTYDDVCTGWTGHAEAVQIVYDPAQIDYRRLLEVFWHNVDPTARERQFCDIGPQYRTAIFYHDEGQRRTALASKEELEQSDLFASALATEIVVAGVFYPAEEYHQKYYLKEPVRYRYYRAGSGRDSRLKEIWGDKAGR